MMPLRHLPFALACLLPTVLLHSTVEAQGITITFSAAIDGVPVPIDSVWVKDMTSGGDTLLYTPDTVLVLDFSTSVNETTAGAVPGLSMSPAVPNPFDGGTRFQVNVEDPGELIVTVHDAVGQVLVSTRRLVERGTHGFSYSGGPQGVLFVEAQWQGQRTVRRLLNMDGGRPVNLRYTGSETAQSAWRLKDGWGTWQLGDSLLYIVFATSPYGYIFSAVEGGTLTGPETPLIDLLPGVVCAAEPVVADIDGNIYPVVQIGDQCWMAANLKTSRYNDGTIIPHHPGSEWDSQWVTFEGAWCNYANDAANDAIYGKLYNWYTVDNVHGLCPTGWHVPADTEWTALTEYLGGEEVAAGKLKAVGTLSAGTGLWQDPNTGATNETGFSGLPGGVRNPIVTGSSEPPGFNYLGEWGIWWSATVANAQLNYAWFRGFYYTNSWIGYTNYFMKDGFSVRCVRD